MKNTLANDQSRHGIPIPYEAEKRTWRCGDCGHELFPFHDQTFCDYAFGSSVHPYSRCQCQGFTRGSFVTDQVVDAHAQELQKAREEAWDEGMDSAKQHLASNHEYILRLKAGYLAVRTTPPVNPYRTPSSPPNAV
jgi:hypothetical protein